MSFRRWMLVAVALLLGFFGRSARVAAQTMTTGSVQGTVTNPKNAVVPNATVALTDNAKGTVQTTTTNLSGNYQFGLLDPGSYTIRVTAPTFQPSTKVVTVPLGEPVHVDFQLSTQPQKGVIRQTASQLGTQNGNLGITLSRLQARDIPNPGNDMTYLAQFSPGTVMNTAGGTGNFSNYGMPATSNRFRVDGMDEMDPFVGVNYAGATNLMLGANEVQEVSIVSNGYSGNYGEFAGESVDYLTSSGQNAVHGNANYFWNQRFLNANSFFNNAAALPRPFDGQNQWQGSLGGPLRRNKAFFFINTEGLRVLVPSTATVIFPSPQFQAATAANLEGNEPTSTANVFRPDVSTFYSSQLFSLLNNAPQAITSLDNQPPGITTVNGIQTNTGDGCGNFNLDSQFFGSGALPCSKSFTSSQANLSTEWLVAFRFDVNVTPSNRVFFRYQMDRGNQVAYSDPISSQFNVRSSQPEKQAQLEWTHSFGASAANQFVLGGQTFKDVFLPPPPSFTQVNFPTTIALADGSFFSTAGPNPCVNPPLGAGLDILVGGQTCDLPRGRNTADFQVSDDFTVTSGINTVKLGGFFRRLDVSDHDFGALKTGLLVINSINDFFTGGVSGDSLTQSFPQSLNQPIAYYTSGGYFEDDFRYSKTLSFQLAFRVEHDSNPICRHLCFAKLAGQFNIIANGANQNQLAQIPYNQAIQTNQLQALPLGVQNILYEPRFSFAWQPFGVSGKTVLRGGVGVFHDLFPPQIVDDFAQNPPLNATFVTRNDFIVPASSAQGPSIFVDSASTNSAFQTGFLTGENFPTILANSPGFTPPSIFTTESKLKRPVYYKWDLELQRQFGDATLVSLSYVGNHGVHEPVNDNSMNAFGFASLPSNAPDPRFGGVTMLFAGGYSHYNGGTLAVSHRMSGFLGTGVIQGSYTYSHLLDVSSNGGFSPFSTTSLLNPQDPANFVGSYGNSDYDVRHSGNVNAVWELPLRRWVGKTTTSYLLDGWQLSGTLFARSGLPYSVVDGALSQTLAANNNYFGQVLPAFLGGPQSCDTSIPSCFLPLTAPIPQNCFALDAAACQFNVGGESAFTTRMRNVFRGPRFFNADVALMKSTALPFWEGARLGLGVQVYNVLNHPNFGLPVNNAASLDFGQILNTVSSPTSIFGSFLGADSSPRLIQLKATLTF